ncbi:MAG TPA: PQQ-binding-like beta-propeller repeat protein [Ilumatobacteraceae bacterium]
MRANGCRVLASLAIGMLPLVACGSENATSTSRPVSVPARGSTRCAADQEPALGAYDVASGSLLWMYCSADQTWRSLFDATADIAYVESTTADSTNIGNPLELIAVDAHTGTELWRVAHTWSQLQWPLGSFTGAGIIVLPVKAESGDTLVGLDAGTGEVRWQIAADDNPTGAVPVANTDHIVVVAGSFGAGVRGLDRTTGAQMWVTDLQVVDESGVMTFRGATAVDGDLVVVPTGATMVALDANTGDTRWEGPRLDHPVAAHGYVIGGVPGRGSPRPDSQSRVLNATTGDEVITLDGYQSYGELWAISPDVVFLSDIGDGSSPANNVAYELPTGTERWRQPPTFGEPQQVVDGNVIVRWRTSVAMLSGTDGSTLWTLASPAESTGGIGNVDVAGAIVFVTFDALPPGD